MDIYLPPNIQFSGQLQQQLQGSSDNGSADIVASSSGGGRDPAGGGGGSGSQGAPVVLFCHGGVWASGSKWHYAPLATRLAQAGVITAVMQVLWVLGCWVARVLGEGLPGCWVAMVLHCWAVGCRGTGVPGCRGTGVPGCRVPGAGCWLPVAGCWLPGARCWVLGAGELGLPGRCRWRCQCLMPAVCCSANAC